MSRDRRAAAWFLLPATVVLVIFAVYPLLESFRLSFYRLILNLPWLGQKFVGWENYQDLLTDPVALKSIATTLLFVVVTAPAEVATGLAFALVLNESFRGRGLIRAVILIPWAVPTVVASQMANGTLSTRAKVRASSVLPDPVGPMSRILDFSISTSPASASAWISRL